MNPQKLLLIGASTGGPGRIHMILEALPSDFQHTIIIGQHMGAAFIPSFIKQLQSHCVFPIQMVSTEQKLDPKTVYVCQYTSRIVERNGAFWIQPDQLSYFNFNPEIDTLFFSAAHYAAKVDILGIILTGIGDDGAEGSRELHRAGGKCFFENEESAIVYGMPRRAKELVPEAPSGNLDDILSAIREFGKTYA